MFYNDYSSHAYFLNSVCAYLYIIILNKFYHFKLFLCEILSTKK